MRNMTALVQNEWLKLTKKKSFWVSPALLVAITGLVTFMLYKFGTDVEEMGSGVAYMAGMLGASGMGQFIAILSVVATSGIIAQEYAQGTIKFLLIRSRSRGEILISKYLVVLLYILMMMAIAAVVLFIVGGMAFGFGGTGEQWIAVLKQATYGFVYSLVYASFAFMIGVLTRSTGVAIGVGLTGTMFGGILIYKDFYKYVLFPNADLSVYGNMGPPLPGMTLGFSILVLVVYVALFLVAGYTVFRRRDVA